MPAEGPHSAGAQPPTLRVAELASGLTFDRLPPQVVTFAGHCVLDTVGVMLAGSAEPVSRILLEEAAEAGGAAQATVIGSSMKLPLAAAALVNGTAVHALDFDDCNLTLSGHVSAVVMPPVLALAEMNRASGSEFITAFVAGFEAGCRIGWSLAPGHYDRGFHATGTVGTFAAAAGAARMLGFDTETTAAALGVAGTMAAGLKGLFGTMCKPLHAGRAAQSGLTAARLVARGLQSRNDVLEIRQGFADCFAPEFHPERIDAVPARGFHILNDLFKYHAACYGVHGVIGCGNIIRERDGPDLADVRRIVLDVAVENDKTCNVAEPADASEARFSLTHAAAMALAGHDTGSADAYGERSLADPAVAALRSVTEVRLDPKLDIAESRMEVTMDDGTVLRSAFDAGLPASDLAAQQRLLEAKFDALVLPILGAARTGELKSFIQNLPAASDMGELVRLCAR